MTRSIIIKNNQTIPLREIPVLGYDEFLEYNTSLLREHYNHCVNYFGFPQRNEMQLICCIANDSEHEIFVSSSVIDANTTQYSFTKHHLSFHIFERELAEISGINYCDHPWLKPVRFPADRKNKNSQIIKYPFYNSHSEELHEVDRKS